MSCHVIKRTKKRKKGKRKHMVIFGFILRAVPFVLSLSPPLHKLPLRRTFSFVLSFFRDSFNRSFIRLELIQFWKIQNSKSKIQNPSINNNNSEVEPINQPAVKLYRKFGFVPYNEDGKNNPIDWRSKNIYMIKKLS